MIRANLIFGYSFSPSVTVAAGGRDSNRQGVFFGNVLILVGDETRNAGFDSGFSKL